MSYFSFKPEEHTAQTRHLCDTCLKEILPGQRYFRQTHFESGRYHTDKRHIHKEDCPTLRGEVVR